MNKQTNLNQMKKYIKPTLVKVVVDKELSLVMLSGEGTPPPFDPEYPVMPGVVSKAFKFLIR